MEERQIEMLPEPVEQRLEKWSLAGRNQGARDACRNERDIQAEFLAATRLPCLSSRFLANTISPSLPLQGLHEATTLPIRFERNALRYPHLPLDIVIEVATYVCPLDLIHLAQTSKQLRQLFMSKTNRMIWKRALSDVPELPPCPGDMCEPLYVALVFGKYCFGCGAEDAFWVDYALRLRMCEACYKTNVVEGTEMLGSLPQDSRHIVSDVLLMLVPSANIFNFDNLDASFDRINPLYHLQEDFYFKPQLEAMLALIWPVPVSKDVSELKELIRIRANYVMMRQMHAVLIHAWDNLCAAPTSESDFFGIKKLYRDIEYMQVLHCDWDEVCAPENPVFAGYLSGKGSRGTSID